MPTTGVIEFDKASGQFKYNVVPKHPKRGGHTIWDSWRMGTRRKTMNKDGDVQYYSENLPKAKQPGKKAAREAKKAAA